MLSFLHSPTLTSIHDYLKNLALTRHTFVGKVMSQLFNMLSRKDWGQEEKGITEDKMAGWHHWLDGPGSEWTPGVGAGQGGLAYCYSWGRKQSDTTERLNWTEWRVVITFVPRSRILLISWLKSPSAVLLEPPKIVCQWFHCFPIYFLGNDGTRCHDLSFLNVEL